MSTPFDLTDTTAYEVWRANTYLDAPPPRQAIFQTIANPARLSVNETGKLLACLSHYNLVIFKTPDPDAFGSDKLTALARQLGLHHADHNLYADEAAISQIKVTPGQRRGEYIPYTNKPLRWHTDGYYNSPAKTIRSFILYCMQDAVTGGENQLLDPTQIYIRLRDENPDYIHALSQPDVLYIPETIENEVLVRPAQRSAVFSVDHVTGCLLMRYTQRKCHIKWKDDPLVLGALARIRALLAGECPAILTIRLQPGEGLLCHNILHARHGFENTTSQQRLYLRARYYERPHT